MKKKLPQEKQSGAIFLILDPQAYQCTISVNLESAALSKSALASLMT